jgi:hypothetical protein
MSYSRLNEPMKSRRAADEALRLDAEEAALVEEGLMRLPIKNKSDDFLALPAPQVAMADIQAVIRAERDED